MRWVHRARILLVAAGTVGALAAAGCGGGGGSSPSAATGSRSYSTSAGTQRVSVSVDTSGHVTVYALDTASLPGGAGAQGTIGSNGQFTALSADGTIQVSGVAASSGASATGKVQQNGTDLFAFTLQAVANAGATPAGLAGTFSCYTTGATAILTVDATSHATLWAQVTSGTTIASGGGLLTVAADGTVQTSDGSTAGQFTASGGTYTLTLSRLGGTSLSGTSLTMTPTTGGTKAKWTFMVFLNGANNLEEFGPLNFNQMEKVGSTKDVNIVVQWKQANCYDCGTPDWVSTRRYFVTKDSDTSAVHSQLVQDMGPSIDMGDWRELRNFVVWTQQRYPANHYALVIWDHGAGWRPTRSAQDRRMVVSPRSVSIDDSTNNEIETWELPAALNVTPAVDMVVFDASLMQMTEVAYEIRNSAQIVVGSEESPPGEGYVYDTFLSDLVANPDMTAAQLGTQIVTRTLQSYGTDNNLTQSCLDLSKMQNVATRLSAFADSLIAHASDSKTAEQNARNSAQNYVYPENKDLWDYAELIRTGGTPADLQNAASAVQTAIQASVIAEQHGTINGRSHGLAIYVPAPANYLTSYSNLALSRVTDWPRWLQGQP